MSDLAQSGTRRGSQPSAFAQGFALATLLATLTAPAVARAQIVVSPDVTLALSTEVVAGEDAVLDDMAGTLVTAFSSPVPNAELDAYHEDANGDQLMSFDVLVDLGTVTAFPGDVVRYDGSSYSKAFDADLAGVPDGVDVDAVSRVDGDLVLSFDTTVSLGGVLFADEDLVRFDGTTFSLLYDLDLAGIDRALDLDGAHYDRTDRSILVSFDASGSVAGTDFDDEDVLRYEPGPEVWALFYDGSAADSAWAPADVNAVATPVPEPNAVLALGCGAVLLSLLERRRRPLATGGLREHRRSCLRGGSAAFEAAVRAHSTG